MIVSLRGRYAEARARLEERAAERFVRWAAGDTAMVLLAVVAFALGVMGIVFAVLIGGGIEWGLRAFDVHGRVSEPFFSALAGLMPVLAIGLLIQLATLLGAGLRRLPEAPPRLADLLVARGAPRAQAEELVSVRTQAEELVREVVGRAVLFVILPVAAGLAVQFTATEGVVLYCLAAGVDARGVAIVLGAEVGIIFAHMILFSIAFGVLRGGP